MTSNSSEGGMPELLPCPFCSRSGIADYGNDHDDDFHIFCGSCKSRTRGFNAISKAIIAWNTRADLASAQPAAVQQEAEKITGRSKRLAAISACGNRNEIAHIMSQQLFGSDKEYPVCLDWVDGIIQSAPQPPQAASGREIRLKKLLTDIRGIVEDAGLYHDTDETTVQRFKKELVEIDLFLDGEKNE